MNNQLPNKSLTIYFYNNIKDKNINLEYRNVNLEFRIINNNKVHTFLDDLSLKSITGILSIKNIENIDIDNLIYEVCLLFGINNLLDFNKVK